MLSCRDAQAGSKKRWKTFPLVQQKEIQICYFLWVPWGQPGQGRTFLYVLKAMSSTSFSPNKTPAFSTTNPYFWGCYLHCQINQCPGLLPPPCSFIASALQMLLWSGKVLGGNQLFSFGSKSRYCSGDISPLELSPPGSLYGVPTGCLLVSSELQTCSTTLSLTVSFPDSFDWYSLLLHCSPKPVFISSCFGICWMVKSEPETLAFSCSLSSQDLGCLRGLYAIL